MKERLLAQNLNLSFLPDLQSLYLFKGQPGARSAIRAANLELWPSLAGLSGRARFGRSGRPNPVWLVAYFAGRHRMARPIFRCADHALSFQGVYLAYRHAFCLKRSATSDSLV